MAELRNKRHELLAQGIAQGKSQESAYVEAGYSPASARANVSTLLKHDQTILERVSELLAMRAKAQEIAQAVVAEELGYDLKAAMLEAREAFDVAKLKENGGAMVAAATLRAKLNGLLVDRSEVRTGPLDAMEHDELKTLGIALAEIKAEIAVTGIPSSTRH